MSRERLATVRVLSGFPRVSGDEPSTVSGVVELNAFSPRERG